MKKLIFLPFCILILHLNSKSYSQVIQGTITDPLTGKGIPNLTVTLSDCTTVTDSLGHYIMYLGTTGVENQSEEEQSVPTSFRLFQNYPNPFNAGTIIKYQLPKAAKVELRIYNLFGQEIATLLDAQKVAGSYQVRWQGNDKFDRAVASGIYLIRFETGEYAKVRKMIVVR